jgi:hypothetical protein
MDRGGIERNRTTYYSDSSLSNLAIPSGAESGAVQVDSAILADQDLAWIVAAWASMSAEAKVRILALVRGSTSDVSEP